MTEKPSYICEEDMTYEEVYKYRQERRKKKRSATRKIDMTFTFSSFGNKF